MMLSNPSSSFAVALFLLGILSSGSAQQGRQFQLLRQRIETLGLSEDTATHDVAEGSIDAPPETVESDDMLLPLNAFHDPILMTSECQPETLTEDEIVFILSAISDSALITTENTPQNKAFQYIRDYPNGLDSCSSDAEWHQRFALAVFYNSVDNAADKLSGWVPTTTDADTTECNGWFRVYCEENAVTTITFPNLELEGTVPSEIAGLSSLRSLFVMNSPLLVADKLGESLGKLEAPLRSLRLDEIALSGTFPAEVGQLVHLEKLSLIDNGLTSLPTELGELGALQSLHLNENKLRNLPTELGDLSALEVLQLDGNNLTSLPTELGKLVHLEFLSVQRNPSLPLPLPPFLCDLFKTAGKGGRLRRLECGHIASEEGAQWYSDADCCTITNYSSVQSATA